MRELFEVAELVKVAVEDERTGVAFYSALAQAARTQKMRGLFEGLAKQETFHQARFEKMLADLGGVQAREQYEGEYIAYLRTMTGTRAFPDTETALRLAAQCTSDPAAVDLASRFERDTLMLLNELRGMVPEKDKSIVDDITREEQAHLTVLAEAHSGLPA